MKSELVQLLQRIPADRLKATLIDAFDRLTSGPMVEVRVYNPTPKSRIKAFLFDHCELDSSASIGKRDIYAVYCAWCQAKRFEPVVINIFGRQLTSTEPSIICARGIYRGVRLKPV